MNPIIKNFFLLLIISCCYVIPVNVGFITPTMPAASAATASQTGSPSSPEALLLKAAAEDNLSAIKNLISAKGINLDITDKEGFTPLMHTIINRDNEAALALIKAGADVKKPDNEGTTPFMAASFTLNRDIQETLNKAKVDKGKKNKHGLTAYDMVVRRISYFESRKNATKVDSFNGISTDGKIIDYAQYRGKKALLIFFFATWCPLSENITPKVIALRDMYPHEKLEILSVALNLGYDERYGVIKAYQTQKNLPFPVIFDSFLRIRGTFQPSGTPNFVLIDKQDNIVYRGVEIPEDRAIKGCL